MSERTGWEERDAKRLPGYMGGPGQNVVLGVMPRSIFKHKKTALRGVTRKGQARIRLRAMSRAKARANALRRQRKEAEQTIKEPPHV